MRVEDVARRDRGHNVAMAMTIDVTDTQRPRMPSTRDCVRCGLCLESCPTYLELGHEADSPRGRIAIMRAITDGRLEPDDAALGHLDKCLDCRACETACPSSVQYGALLELARAQTADLPRTRRSAFVALREYVLFRVLPSRRRLTRWLRVARLAEALGIFDLLQRTGLARRFSLPLLTPLPATEEFAELPVVTPAARTAEPAGDAALFVGCAAEVLTPQTSRAAAFVLSASGRTVHTPSTQACCGAIHHHAGRVAEAIAMARTNIAAFESTEGPIINAIAGCGAMLKHYGTLLAGDHAFAKRAARFSARVKDVHEVLADCTLPPMQALPRRVIYHDACHLCHAQGIRRQPRDLLRRVPGLELIEIAESEVCCGAAGSYSVLEPEMSARLAARKWSHLAERDGDLIATGNVGCILQIRQHAPAARRDTQVVHPIEIIAAACGDESAGSARLRSNRRD